MYLLVYKFGGSSVADAAGLRCAAGQLAAVTLERPPLYRLAGASRGVVGPGGQLPLHTGCPVFP